MADEQVPRPELTSDDLQTVIDSLEEGGYLPLAAKVKEIQATGVEWHHLWDQAERPYKRAKFLMYEFLRVLEASRAGEDLRPGLERTPHRVSKMWLEELTAGYAVDIPSLFRTFDDHEDYEGMVVLTKVPVTSQCEHHLVPFVGYASVGYFPSDRVIGLSKIPRLVDAYSRRLQLQERLTQQIHDSLVEHLDPRGVIVVLECEHLCMTLRGVQSPGTKTITSAVSGLFRNPKERAREEFFNLVGFSA